VDVADGVKSQTRRQRRAPPAHSEFLKARIRRRPHSPTHQFWIASNKGKLNLFANLHIFEHRLFGSLALILSIPTHFLL
jgi:hypothetical protein